MDTGHYTDWVYFSRPAKVSKNGHFENLTGAGRRAGHHEVVKCV